MNNLTTREFCRDFGACPEGTRFALKFETMKDCYAALLRGEAGEKSAGWAVWTITREGVISDRNLRLFAVRCARRVQHLMTDERIIKALDAAERYANGEATDDELAAARAAAYAAHAAAYAVACAAHATASAAAYAAARAACVVHAPAYYAARAAERRAQLEILAEFGNPFEETKDE
jgi:hypothetical protein